SKIFEQFCVKILLVIGFFAVRKNGPKSTVRTEPSENLKVIKYGSWYVAVSIEITDVMPHNFCVIVSGILTTSIYLHLFLPHIPSIARSNGQKPNVHTKLRKVSDVSMRLGLQASL